MLAGDKKKDWSPILSPIALFHNLIFIDTGNQRKSGLSVSLGTKNLENVPAGVLEFLAGNKNGCYCSRSEALKQV